VSADSALVISRFLHFAALLYVFGGAFFPFYAFSKDEREASALLAFQHKGSIFAACLLALASGFAWLFFASVSMAGSYSEAMDSEMMGTVLLGTSFGKVWIARLILVTAVVILAGFGPVRSNFWLAVLSAAALGSLAGVGHTQSQDGMDALIHMAADSAHLLAAGAWLGGLVPLAAILAGPPKSGVVSQTGMALILRRFSAMGSIAVPVLLASGSINSWYLAGSISRLTASPYGVFLSIKLGLFALMLLFACVNRFWLTPKVAIESGTVGGAMAIRRLRGNVFFEQAFGALVLIAVSIMGTLPPGATPIP